MTDIANPIIAARIKFPATQVPSADLNTLDDYKETVGFPVTMTCGTSGTVTLTSGEGSNTGHATKIGRHVFFGGRCVVASMSSPMGVLRIAGLPYTVANLGGAAFPVTIYAALLENTATTAMQARCEPNTTNVIVERFTAGANADAAPVMKAGSIVQFSGHYIIG